jgi:hypothetical protein
MSQDFKAKARDVASKIHGGEYYSRAIYSGSEELDKKPCSN